MTGVLVRLEGAGWIIRRPNAIDGRGVRIEASGFERLTDIYRDGNRRLDEIDACLTAEQASIVLDYLQTVTNSVRAASLGLVSRCESDWPVRPPIE
jgi:DNA-binding MarR family transcriptional regulator